MVRNVLHFGGQYAWVYAISMLPLELSVLLGAAVIFAGTYYSIRRESR